MQQNKVAAAQAAFEQALRANPNHAESHYNLGSLQLQRNELDNALQSFRRSAQANPNYANAYYAAGLVFMRQGKFADAQKVLQYAKDLYTTQKNSQWAARAEQQLQKAKSGQP